MAQISNDEKNDSNKTVHPCILAVRHLQIHLFVDFFSIFFFLGGNQTLISLKTHLEGLLALAEEFGWFE